MLVSVRTGWEGILTPEPWPREVVARFNRVVGVELYERREAGTRTWWAAGEPTVKQVPLRIRPVVVGWRWRSCRLDYGTWHDVHLTGQAPSPIPA